TAAIRPASVRRDSSLNVWPSQRMTVPAASPVTIVLPSADHAAAVTTAAWPSSTWLPTAEPAAQAQSTLPPVARSTGPVATTRLPCGSTAIGAAYRSEG